MELTPEERRKIYEEEKARIEAREQIEREKRGSSQETSVSMDENVAGLLCYLGAWVTGILFLIFEQKNNWVRFHAAQSLVVFGILFIAGMALGWIPFIGPVFSAVIGITGFILWIVLMVKAYHGERYKVIWASDIAEKIIGLEPPTTEPEKPPAARVKDSTEPSLTPSPASTTIENFDKKAENFFEKKREGRIAGSAFAIAFCVILLVFFNFFRQYAAYYSADTVNGVIVWTRSPFFTWEISRWLPILNTTLGISIVVHIILIIFDFNRLRKVLLFFVDALALATVITLVSVFPFNFNVIPNNAAAIGTQIGVTIVLIGIAIGLGISLLVRVIKLLIYIGKNQPYQTRTE
jgi:uncharacterized membrane protein